MIFRIFIGILFFYFFILFCRDYYYHLILKFDLKNRIYDVFSFNLKKGISIKNFNFITEFIKISILFFVRVLILALMHLSYVMITNDYPDSW